MTSRFEVTWGAVSSGRLSVNPAIIGEAYIGNNVSFQNWSIVSNSYPDTGYRQGYTQFVGNAYCDTYGYFISSAGSCALKPNIWKTIYLQSIFVNKGEAPEAPFDYALYGQIKSITPPSGVTYTDVVGQLFIDTNGNYYDSEGNIISLPNGVTLVANPFNNVYLGSDGHYYNSEGQQIFTNLPSGVTLGNQYGDFFIGSDGNFYDSNGDEVFENIPPDIVPTSENIGEAYSFSDGNYYEIDGDEAFSNLPSGVTITGYDSEHDNYFGSDGEKYDIDGNPTSDCNGNLLQYNNQIRLVMEFEDIYGNPVTISQDLTIGQTFTIATVQGTMLRKIKRILARNINNTSSCGFGNLRIRGDVVGAKIEVDLPLGVDVDAVLGNYEVCSCVFQACNRYADIVYNLDLPLGWAQDGILDVGYYCLTDTFQLSYEGFSNEEFPYCCGSYDDSEKSGGALGKDNQRLDVDVQCICDGFDTLNSKLDTLIEKVDYLQCICDSLDRLIGVIEDKDFSITVESPVNNVSVESPINNVTVQPPVNNVSVQPPVNTVTVQPPVNNVSVQPPVNNVTVQPCSPIVNNVVDDDNTDICNKLDEIFKIDNSTGGKDNITKVIKDKEFETCNDITIESQDWAYCGKCKFEFDDDVKTVANP